MTGDDWILSGDALSVDFVNTLRDRWSDTPRETLATERDVASWMQRAGLPTLTGTADHTRSLSLRAALEALFERRASADQLQLINAACRGAPRPPLFHTDDGVSARLPDALSFEEALGLIAADANRLVVDDLLPRVGVCQHERCGLLFLDTSRGGRRQWCSMQRCGNRAKVARFERRRRAVDG